MGDFIRDQGPAFLAHLLRRISDDLVAGAAAWYPEAGVHAAPRTASTLLALADRGPLGVTEIADILRQSHPLVITWVRQLRADGFVRVRPDAGDRRRSVVALTPKGSAEVARLRNALIVMGDASRHLMESTGRGVFEALWHIADTCSRTPFAQQLRERETLRSTRKVRAGKVRR